MRLFIGFPLSAAARKDTAALAARVQASIPGRYVLESNYHVTLAFLGEVSEQQLDAAKSALDACAARFCAPHLTLGGLSHFDRPSNAILIRTAESPDDLFAMRRALMHELSIHAIPFTEGPFAPHVTLARHANVTNVHPDTFPVSRISFSVPQAALYLSARDEENILRYTPLHMTDFLNFL